METIKKLGLAALILVSSFYGCEKSDIRPDTAPSKTKEVVEVPMWRVMSFQWHNGERNDQFNDYIFRFETTGAIAVIYQDERYFGRWTRMGDILKIDFPTAPLNLLNNKWTVLEDNRTLLKLGGLSPYDNSAEIIQFQNMNGVDPN